MENRVYLLESYCELVNEINVFIREYFEGIVPAGKLNQDIYWKTKGIYEQVAAAWEQGKTGEAEELLAEFLDYAVSYWEEGRPWDTCLENRPACRNTVLNSVQLVANLTVLLMPVWKHPAGEVCRWLNLDDCWQVQKVRSGYELPELEYAVNYAFHIRQNRVS